jgi:sodium/potassium/calcium exchanger 6
MSESLAGITLVALGNGAPDVITAIVAGKGGSEGDDDSPEDSGIAITIGSIFGANLFVTTVTLARVIYMAKEIKVRFYIKN